jgi:hypothetical protein
MFDWQRAEKPTLDEGDKRKKSALCITSYLTTGRLGTKIQNTDGPF